MIRLLLLFVIAFPLFSQPASVLCTAPFRPNCQMDDKASGIAFTLTTVHDGPACREKGTCEWIVNWSAKKSGDRMHIEVLFVALDGVLLASQEHEVPALATAEVLVRNPVFSAPLGDVKALRFTLLRGDSRKVVLLKEFR